MQKARQTLTQHYKQGGVSPFGDEAKLLAYLGARMPATFAAVAKVLQNVSLQGHLLDLGAGLGSATWAALSLFPSLQKVTLIEQNKDAIAIGKKLLPSEKLTWIHQDLMGRIPHADYAILSYVLNELNDPEKIVENCWDAVETLILVEPGHPRPFRF